MYIQLTQILLIIYHKRSKFFKDFLNFFQLFFLIFYEMFPEFFINCIIRLKISTKLHQIISRFYLKLDYFHKIFLTLNIYHKFISSFVKDAVYRNPDFDAGLYNRSLFLFYFLENKNFYPYSLWGGGGHGPNAILGYTLEFVEFFQNFF